MISLSTNVCCVKWQQEHLKLLEIKTTFLVREQTLLAWLGHYKIQQLHNFKRRMGERERGRVCAKYEDSILGWYRK